MTKLDEPRKSASLNLHEVRPNSGTPAGSGPLQWMLHHQSPLPWVNSLMLVPVARPVPDEA